jgi:hypothetical protein
MTNEEPAQPPDTDEQHSEPSGESADSGPSQGNPAQSQWAPPAAAPPGPEAGQPFMSPPGPPPPPVPVGGTAPAVSTAQRGHAERRALLAQQLQQAAARGLRVESQTDYQAVLVEGRPVNHILHAILTVFTCLLWGIVWAVIAATGGEKRHQLIVDDFGNVHWQNLGKV